MTDPYSASGVSLEAAARAVELIKDIAARASRPEVKAGVGGFAGLFEISEGRYLVAATDGVGTKVEMARLAGRLDTVGADLVAMCADDVVCTGAEPLFFLDYLAVGRLVPEEAASLVEGVAEGCRQAGCALLGGETAEHPGVMELGRFDLAGFCVGAVEERNLLGSQRVEDDDVLVGLESSGLHSNGFSLVRRVLLDEGGFDLDETTPRFARSLGDELLEPTRIYSLAVVDLAKRGLVHAAAHITGGGLVENVPRMLPPGLGAVVDTSTWVVPPIFGFVQEAAGASREEMFRVLNMGIGMVLVVPRGKEDEVLADAQTFGCPAHVIGSVATGRGLILR